MRSKYLQDQSDIFHFSLPLIASRRLSIWHKSMICLGFVMVWIDLIYCSRPSFKDEPKQRRLSSWRGRLHQVPCDCLRRGPGPALGLSDFTVFTVWGKCLRPGEAVEERQRPSHRDVQQHGVDIFLSSGDVFLTVMSQAALRNTWPVQRMCMSLRGHCLPSKEDTRVLPLDL